MSSPITHLGAGQHIWVEVAKIGDNGDLVTCIDTVESARAQQVTPHADADQVMPARDTIQIRYPNRRTIDLVIVRGSIRLAAAHDGKPMNLHIHNNLDQGTEEWMAARRGIVTASAVGKLVTTKTLAPANTQESRGLTRLLVAERITGWTEETYISDDMWRGIEDEPIARDLYSAHHTKVAEVGFMVRDDWGFQIGYSPDGVVGDDGLIEIKSRRPKKHVETILANEVPTENYAQLQCGLLVSGRSWCDYVSFCGGMPLWTKRVEPDQRWHDAIIAAVRLFEDNATDMEAKYREAVKGLPATERRRDDLEIKI